MLGPAHPKACSVHRRARTALVGAVTALALLAVACTSEPTQGALSPHSSAPGASEASAVNAEQAATPLQLITRGASGTFAIGSDGIASGTISGLDAATTWVHEVTKHTGTAETGPTLNLVEGQDGADPLVIHVTGAPEDQDVVIVDLSARSFDASTNTLSFQGRVKTDADPSLDEYAIDADPSVAATFGASTVVIADHDSTAVLRDGELQGSREGGTIDLGFGPGVKVNLTLADFNCVENAPNEERTTTGWREVMGFLIDTISFASGCGARASWAVWNVSVGAPHDATGQVWLGQNAPGGGYYARCQGTWTNASCAGVIPGLDGPDGGRGVVVLPPRCGTRYDNLGHPYYVIELGKTCANWGKHPFDLTPNTWFLDDGRFRHGELVNISGQTCQVDRESMAPGAKQYYYPPPEVIDPHYRQRISNPTRGYSTTGGYCFFVYTGVG